MPEASNDPRRPAPRERHWLERSARTPARARHLLALFLGRVEGGARYLATGRLLVSELTTNAIRHGTRSGQRIRVGFWMEDGHLFVAVEDPSGEKPVPRQATCDREAGRGLLLVEALAEEWGVAPREGVGKHVWAKCAPEDGCYAG